MGLIDVLKEEKRLLLEMMDILKAEKDALMKDNIKELDIIVKSKEDLKCTIEVIEKQKFNLVGGKKLREILPTLNETERYKASSLGADIDKIVYDIQEANETNSLLVKQSLNYVRSLINILSPAKSAVYGSSGKVEGGNNGSSLLNRSV